MMIDSYSIFRDELGPGERILWTDQPQQGILFRGSDFFMIPFSLMWAGFAFFWEFMVISSDAPWLFMLWGIPFVLMGLYISIGRFFADMHLRKNSYYALTNERIIIISGLFRRSVRSLNLRTLPDMEISEKGDGRGTITFGPKSIYATLYAGMPGINTGRYPIPPTFEAIENARRVYQLVRQAQRDAYAGN